MKKQRYLKRLQKEGFHHFLDQHVHISKGKSVPNATKVWLTKSGGCILANNKSNISSKDLSELLEAIVNNYFYIVLEWKRYFKVEEVKFYC